MATMWQSSGDQLLDEGQVRHLALAGGRRVWGGGDGLEHRQEEDDLVGGDEVGMRWGMRW